MPELPEVETVVQDLRAAGFEGARVTEIRILRPSVVHGAVDLQAFAQALRGRILRRIDRRAKYIRILLDNGQVLLIHLRMTGRLRLCPSRTEPHDRLILRFSDGRALHFHDTRAFGRFRLVEALDAAPLDRLGPEPLTADFTAQRLHAALTRRHRMLKPLLLDQGVVAGLGNIYVDEALWAARLHPARVSDSLSMAETRRLHRAIRTVLRCAVGLGGTTLGSSSTNFYSVSGRRGNHADKLNVFRRHGEACPRCGRELARSILSQRGTHWCPQCQPEPRRRHAC